MPARLFIFPTPIEFGDVTVGTTEGFTLTLENVGDETLIIEVIEKSGDRENAFSPDQAFGNVSIVPGGAASFRITFSPQVTGQHTASYQIFSNDAQNEEIDLSVSGSGVTPSEPQPDIDISPNSYDFGDVEVGNFQLFTITIWNHGIDTARVDDITITGANTSAFAVLDPDTPLSMGPGGFIKRDVSFTPPDSGVFTAAMTVISNDPVTPSLSAPLLGTGFLTPQPDLEVDKTEVGFGSLELNQQETATLMLSNIGNETITVTGLNITTSPELFNVSSRPNLPFNISPGFSTSIILSFSAPDSGDYTTTLKILSNDLEEPEISVRLFASVLRAVDLFISRRDITFDSTVIGQSDIETTALSNVGTEPVQISDITITNPPHPFTWNLTQFDIAPGEILTLELGYFPTTTQGAERVVEIYSNDDRSPQTITIRGGGQPAPAQGIPPDSDNPLAAYYPPIIRFSLPPVMHPQDSLQSFFIIRIQDDDFINMKSILGFTKEINARYHIPIMALRSWTESPSSTEHGGWFMAFSQSNPLKVHFPIVIHDNQGGFLSSSCTCEDYLSSLNFNREIPDRRWFCKHQIAALLLLAQWRGERAQLLMPLYPWIWKDELQRNFPDDPQDRDPGVPEALDQIDYSGILDVPAGMETDVFYQQAATSFDFSMLNNYYEEVLRQFDLTLSEIRLALDRIPSVKSIATPVNIKPQLKATGAGQIAPSAAG